MRRRSLVIAALVAAGLGGIAAVAKLGPFAEPAGTGADPVSLARRVPEGITLRTSPRLPEAREPRPHVTVDLARVEAALARLEKSTAQITPEQIAAEQRKMLEAKTRFEAIRVAEPTTRKFTDSNGTRWVELKHESGELRYQLDSDPDEPGADPTGL